MTQERSVRPPQSSSEEDVESPFEGLRSPYLASLAKVDRERIADLAERTAEALEAWAAAYRVMNPARVRPLSLAVAAAAPFCDVPALLSTARMSLWVFALDDLFDEERLPDAELKRAAARYQALARGRDAPHSGGDMEQALEAIRRELSGYPLFPPLEKTWVEALNGTIGEMQREDAWRHRFRRHGVSQLPSYETYLDCGRYSIGGPPHVWTALITIGDPTTPAQLAHLRQMEQLASTCIRLANDLQSREKELVEDNVNSLLILEHGYRRQGHAPDEALRMAEGRIRRHIGRFLAQLGRLQAEVKTRTGYPEAAIANIARFVSEFYQSHDFHTFSPKSG